MKKGLLGLLMILLWAGAVDAAPVNLDVTLEHDGNGVTSYVLYLVDEIPGTVVCEGAQTRFTCDGVTMAYGEHAFAATAKGPGGESAKIGPLCLDVSVAGTGSADDARTAVSVNRGKGRQRKEAKGRMRAPHKRRPEKQIKQVDRGGCPRGDEAFAIPAEPGNRSGLRH